MRYLLVLFLVVISNNISGQSLKIGSLISGYNQKVEVKGVVLDAENNEEPLFFAEVTVKELNKTVKTEIDGSFKFNLKPGSYTLIYKFIGYKTVEIANIEMSLNKSQLPVQILQAEKIESPNLEALAFLKSN
ncbi:carboxypeptidase-like regulatory domain-containing protein [uncultured Lutibacter sp.]|uniref:carboxypeptidase-like regulatory domain-containing protein n=1 Tax=uncultured Lutibacter sp. TaxID=437739 RepID=UPI002617DD53|nr:carboxypeptidase-like regulatory domain-containing protein [uncultured Lutibacter sp.]